MERTTFENSIKSCVLIEVDDTALTQFTLHQKTFHGRQNNNSSLLHLNLHIFKSKCKEYQIVGRLVTYNEDNVREIN